MKTKVVNKKTHKTTENDVYIGRPSIWGNPFIVGRDGTRQEVIDKFKKWIHSNNFQTATLRNKLHTLKGKNLVCWCAPQACHGDILAELADRIEDQ